MPSRLAYVRMNVNVVQLRFLCSYSELPSSVHNVGQTDLSESNWRCGLGEGDAWLLA